MIDLLVAGGGPAGLATAIRAALAGLDVVVAEPRATPIDKACGEGLMPPALRGLTGLGVTVHGHPLRGIRYLDGAHRVAQAPFASGPGLGVRRTDLHTALAHRAAELGVPVLPVRVDGIRQYGDHLQAAGLRARYLAAADGLHSPIRRSLGLALPDDRPARYGLRRHFALAPWSDHVEVHWSAHSEAYVTPLGPELVGVAVLTSRRGPFDRQLADFPLLARRLPPAAALGAARGAGALRQRVRRRVAGRVLLVGDAAGYVDALTGEGISVALAGAAGLVDCLLAGRPQAYERVWSRSTRRYRLLTESLVRLRGRPAAAARIVPVAARWPGLFATAVRCLG
ncbi:NAD(P)/FAD-dependent oxidoreductase [Kitasatospora sp. NPDC057015]|uniref:NAD(P)/FAD-dependent oxidoreductase n=1 Tax=Kitasatospora sp. NPDC057015 TaxID=3346001 RepID=UPI003642D9DB